MKANKNFQKVILENYYFDSEDSVSEIDKMQIYLPVIQNLILKVNRLLKGRLIFFLNTLKLYNKKQVASELKEHYNVRPFKCNESNQKNPIMYDSFNKVIDSNESIRILKIEILRSKLLTLVKIIEKNILNKYLRFFERIKLKLEMQNFFNKDDNYLYILPKPKLFRFRTVYAYRRLIYVIKSYKYRVNFQLRNVFSKWKDILYDYIPKINYRGNQIDINKEQSPMKIFALELIKIIEKYYYFKNIFILNFLYYKQITKLKDIYEMRENTKIENLHRFCIEIRNLFFENRKYIFEQIINFLNKFDLNDKNENEKTNLVSNTFKSLFKIYNLKNSNKILGRKFHQWKKILIIKETIPTYQNSFSILTRILNYNFGSKMLLLKRKFFERLYQNFKEKNTYLDYGKKYEKIPKIINDDLILEKINFLRENFTKIFRLKRLFLNINEKENKISSPLIVNNQKSKIFYKINDNAIISQTHCFYRWKNLVVEDVKAKANRNIKLTRVTNILCDKVYLNFISVFFLRIKNFKKNLSNLTQVKTYTFFAKFLNNFVDTKLKSNKRLLLQKLKNYSLLRDQNKKSNSALLLYLHKQYSEKDLEENKLYLLKKCFKIWKGFNKTKFISNKINLKMIKVFFIALNKYKQNLNYYFNQFKIKSNNSKNVFYLSKNTIRIDRLIIENQSRILSNFEKEENKLNSEILKFKSLSNKKINLLLLIINNKNLKEINYSFKLWKDYKNEISSDNKMSLSITNLIKHNELIQNDNDELMNVYKTKTVLYKKTINDYIDVKEHFCNKCVGDEFEIDYKSVKDLIVEESNENENELNDNKNKSINSDMQVEDEENRNSNISLSKKVSDMEIRIKHLQTVYDQKIIDYESQIKICEEKKQELLYIKNKILSAQNI